MCELPASFRCRTAKTKALIDPPAYCLVATLFGILFLASVDNPLFIALMPLLSRDLGVSLRTLGWMVSAYALAAACFNLLLGPLTDRLGRTLFLRWGLVQLALVALATSFSRGQIVLGIMRMMSGLGGGLLSTCTASFVGDFFPYDRRGRVWGIILTSYFFAYILGVPLGIWMAQQFTWSKVFLLFSAFATLLLGCTLFTLPGTVISLGSTSGSNVYRALLCRRATLAALVVSFGISGGTLALLTYVSALGVTSSQISGLILVLGLAAALSSPLSGWLSDRFTKRIVFLVANTVMVLPLIILHRLEWGIVLVVSFFVISLCIGFRQTALHTLQTELVRSDRRGSFLALRNGFSQLGISISVFLAGSLYEHFGFGGVTSLAAFLTSVSSLVLYCAVEEPKPKS